MRKAYIPSRDYGTRGAEVDRHRISFANTHATIYRRKGGSLVYQFRVYLAKERRQYRKSLHTIDRQHAIELAQHELVNILSAIKTGRRIVSPSVREAFRTYRKHLEHRVAEKDLSALSHRNNLVFLARAEEFLASKSQDLGRTRLDTSISKLDGITWDGYLAWRQTHSPNINRHTVLAELTVIRAAFHYLESQGLCGKESIPKWTFTTDATTKPIRARLGTDEWGRTLKLTRAYANEFGITPAQTYYRQLIHHLYLILGASGMRSHEALKLRHRDIEIHRSKLECVVTIPAAISKVRKARTIAVNASHGGSKHQTQPINYLIRLIDTVCRHREPEHFIFAEYHDGTKSGINAIYKVLGKFRKDKLEPSGLAHVDLTHGRHTFITHRLLAGEPIHLVAKVCATSVKQIEATYSQVLSELVSRQFGKRRVQVSAEGYEVVG
jgi:site-specific recombinase XerD